MAVNEPPFDEAQAVDSRTKPSNKKPIVDWMMSVLTCSLYLTPDAVGGGEKFSNGARIRESIGVASFADILVFESTVGLFGVLFLRVGRIADEGDGLFVAIQCLLALF